MDKPDLFNNPNEKLTSLSQLIAGSIINEARQSAIDQGADSVNSQPTYLRVTSHRASNKGLLDLKPYFANSPKTKRTKDGGWYLIVPIRRKTRDMSYQLYQEAKNIDISNKPMATSPVNSLYSNRRSSSIDLLNYTPKSNNLTRINNGNNGSTYVAFRTVSNKSNPASWIINRDMANQENMSKTLLANVERLIKYRLSHLNE